MDFFFLEIVNCFQSFTIFAKSSILNVWQDFKHGSTIGKFRFRDSSIGQSQYFVLISFFVDVFACQMIQHMPQ